MAVPQAKINDRLIEIRNGETILEADHVIDLGPEAGEKGGRKRCHAVFISRTHRPVEGLP